MYGVGTAPSTCAGLAFCRSLDFTDSYPQPHLVHYPLTVMASSPQPDTPEDDRPSETVETHVQSQSHAETQTQTQNLKQNGNETETVTIQRIQALLETKDDTSRFVGLALLKSVLDNSPQLREDEATITALWQSVSPKFLDRLLRSGAKQPSSSKDAENMMDIAVAVLHTFSVLLPDRVRCSPGLVGRAPALVQAVLHR